MTAPDNQQIQLWLDKAAIEETVQTERAARDQAQWPRMLTCWHPESVVDISWFKGSGADFVAASARVYDAGIRSMHQMGPTLCRVQGDKALAETGCAILLHASVAGVPAFMTSHSRLFSRLSRYEGRWLLLGMRIVYQFDYLTPANSSDELQIDPVRLAGYRPSYRYASYVLVENGQTPNPDLAGADRPETVAALLNAEEAWFAE